ncbi:uncharacterized protein LOC126812577 [Patella vulgata]|uniref:uncharacterized protein LOC126812577 n=1 Tax=Patella vulgata TaxID=6465 RepID=UPI00218024EC|nr:uncharacterized protein LOC126812577 [Patella vulgata]
MGVGGVLFLFLSLLTALVNTDGVPYSETKIEKVHIIFMNHLDVGYNGISPTVGFINNIFNIYYHKYFPRAVALSKAIEQLQSNVTFIYTTHPWLVSSYINCQNGPPMLLNNITLKCPTAQEIGDFEWAVKKGYITWHAGPMNMQPENLNQFLFEQSLNISQQLDNVYGIQRQFKTLSQRDVPGMTQSVIPSLAKYGIKGISVGVNPSTSPPGVPNPFLWQFQGEEVIAMWHKGGYPLNPGPDPSQPGGLSRKDCVIVDGFSEALCFAFRTDNAGPPESVKEILSNYAILAAEFPGAKLMASTFENYVQALYPIKDQLPKASYEIGDTWIQGIASDPLKMSKYRSFSLTLQECFQTGQCDTDDSRIFNAIRYIIKPPEHTWGLPTVNDFIHWSNPDFNIARSDQNFLNCDAAWAEQRTFIDLALASLEDHPVVERVVAGLAELIPRKPDLTNYNIEKDVTQTYYCDDRIQVAFNTQGFIQHLYDPYNKVNWASENNPMGEFLYNSYNDSDFDYMNSYYSYLGNAGFYKINLTDNAHPESKKWPMKLQTLYKYELPDKKCDFMLKLVPVYSRSNTWYGAPSEIFIQYTTRGIDPDVGGYPGGLDIVVQWFDKTSTRLPESLSYSFTPTLVNDLQWRLSKIGHLVDPANVVLNGSQYLHAVDNGAYYIDANGNGLQLLTQDVPLVLLATKKRSPYPFPVPLTPITQQDIIGLGFNFYNNIWDTNYILYYPYLTGDQDLKSRFKVNFFYRQK